MIDKNNGGHGFYTQAARLKARAAIRLQWLNAAKLYFSHRKQFLCNTSNSLQAGRAILSGRTWRVTVPPQMVGPECVPESIT